MLMHGALKVAKEQFLSDNPGSEVANCRVIADEPDRHLVVVFVAAGETRPEPPVLYAVSRDLKSAVRVDPSELSDLKLTEFRDIRRLD